MCGARVGVHARVSLCTQVEARGRHQVPCPITLPYALETGSHIEAGSRRCSGLHTLLTVLELQASSWPSLVSLRVLSSELRALMLVQTAL